MFILADASKQKAWHALQSKLEAQGGQESERGEEEEFSWEGMDEARKVHSVS